MMKSDVFTEIGDVVADDLRAAARVLKSGGMLTSDHRARLHEAHKAIGRVLREVAPDDDDDGLDDDAEHVDGRHAADDEDDDDNDRDGLAKRATGRTRLFNHLVCGVQARHPELSRSAAMDLVLKSDAGEALARDSRREALDGVPIELAPHNTVVVKSSPLDQEVLRGARGLVAKGAAQSVSDGIEKVLNGNRDLFERYRREAIRG